jgi:hypothetical protein
MDVNKNRRGKQFIVAHMIRVENIINFASQNMINLQHWASSEM